MLLSSPPSDSPAIDFDENLYRSSGKLGSSGPEGWAPLVHLSSISPINCYENVAFSLVGLCGTSVGL